MYQTRVNGSNRLTILIARLHFDSFVVWCESKNGYQKDKHLKKNWTTCLKILPTLSSTADRIWGGGGDLYNHLRTTTKTLIVNKGMSS